MFDTGSDLTWTQCKPCLTYCYKQQVDPIFDPAASTSYTNVSCTSSLCSSLYTATYKTPGCSGSTCLYAVQYGDSSFSTGFFAKDTVTLTSTAVFTNFSFGCGQNNQGLYGGAAGILGLARHPISFPSQTASKYKQLFSYCLPSSASYTGHLTFGGAGAASTTIKYTPFSSKITSVYGIDVIGISVSGVKLAINESVFSSGAGIIDSGTVITRLPPTAYSALKTEFRRQMAQYKAARSLSFLDTCYDLSAYATVNIPKVTISFSGGIDVLISAQGTLYVTSPSQVCLAFTATTADTDVLIFGNTQQKTLDVVYDVPRSRLGFASGGCN